MLHLPLCAETAPAILKPFDCLSILLSALADDSSESTFGKGDVPYFAPFV